MTPLPVERELREALSVDARPSFAAGVRARIAAGSELRIDPRFELRTWMPVAAVLGTIALVVWLRQFHAPPTPVHTPLLPSRSMVSTLSVVLPSSSASPFERQDPLFVARVRLMREPEILIAPSESRALVKLIAGPRTWQLDPSPLPAPQRVGDLVIEPIVIAPLSFDGGSQGVRQ